MSPITAILNTQEDGTVHLPVPEDMRARRVMVTVIFQLVPEDMSVQEAGQPAPVTAMIHTPFGFKPDWEAIDKAVYGENYKSHMLTDEDSAFIRDRGDW